MRSTPPRGIIRCLLPFLTALALTAAPSVAQPLLDEETEQLLVDAVTAAADLDLYHSRCRSDGSKRRTSNLNKALVSNLRMTVLEVKDDLFPDGSYRRADERLQRDFLTKLKEAGGCEGAKQAGMPNQLRERYDRLLREIERLP